MSPETVALFAFVYLIVSLAINIFAVVLTALHISTDLAIMGLLTLAFIGKTYFAYRDNASAAKVLHD